MNPKVANGTMANNAAIDSRRNEHLPQASNVLDDSGYDTERILSPEMEAILSRIRHEYRNTAQLEVHPARLKDGRPALPLTVFATVPR
ncbi:hypothetical protein LTS08_008838 [Lithohypha guttulata]|uniref:Uncharacterized protein n=1 Tax=Lithohypha guttulata TaxID=1690604 RepID=A0ABR0K2I0_9EURO|nr:hypothetical protein LTR24_007949 [Lithohypha guttulata]KAK5093751.1 hypothetical protein LTS08_008838 [Lithohypha guttulata]KAK5313376.1 hypothetical protein LTR70_007680 [Exophiala xenobiotica]